MYCNPDFVLNTVTDLPPSVLEVNVGGDVDRGMLATPSISFAYAVEGFVNIVDVDDAIVDAAMRQAWLIASLLLNSDNSGVLLLLFGVIQSDSPPLPLLTASVDDCDLVDA